ncbi:hypothetical protein [Solidesulfovibrio sp. C21]|uniref:hypothetical protein n=1 Tax=Solidesulfovibrio sp. C21 TaxID=3398613 RepID=UPI0039FC789F
MESNSSPPLETLTVIDLELDPRVEARHSYRSKDIDEYARIMSEGDELPPISVFEIDSKLVVVDGWHRVKAAIQADLLMITGKVYRGFSLEEAITFAAQSNDEHGLRRSRSDKEKAVTIVLCNEKLQKKSDHDVARICKVSHPFVSKIRKRLIAKGMIAKNDVVISSNGKVMKSRDLWSIHKNNTNQTLPIGNVQFSGTILDDDQKFKVKEYFESNSSDDRFANHVFNIRLKTSRRIKKMIEKSKADINKNSAILREVKEKIAKDKRELKDLESDSKDDERYIHGQEIFKDIFLDKKIGIPFNLP